MAGSTVADSETGRDYIYGSDGLKMEAMPFLNYSEIGSVAKRE